MLLTDLLESTGAGGDELAVTFDDACRTRGSLRRSARRRAAELIRRGVRPGDRVAILSAGRIEVLEAFFATSYAGGIDVVINSFLKGAMLAHQLELTAPRVVLTDAAGKTAVCDIVDTLTSRPLVLPIDEPLELLPEVPDDAVLPGSTRRPEDPATIIFTSGTTGRSKGCVISHRYFLEAGRRMTEHFPLGEEDVYHSPYPMFHIGGQCAALSWSLTAGSDLVLDSEFHASTYWDRIREVGATYSQGTGAIGAALLARPPAPNDQDNPLVRASFIPMAAEAQAAFADRFGVTIVSEWYGQTEMSPICMNLSAASGGTSQGAMGFPLPDVEVRIVDAQDEPVPAGQPGELLVRPRRAGIMFSGYWNQPDRTVAAWRDLWYRTGDVVAEKPDGSLGFVDRASDSVRRSGENVSCFEVEQVLLRLPGVSRAAVHALPAELIEDDIKAWIECEAGSGLSAKDVFEHCAARLPYFAVPRYVEFTDTLPLNALGKVTKEALREAGATAAQLDLRALGLVVARTDRR